LDGTVVRVRLDRKATSIWLLIVLGIRRDGQKVLLAVRNMGGESEAAWRGLLDESPVPSAAAQPPRRAARRTSDPPPTGSRACPPRHRSARRKVAREVGVGNGTVSRITRCPSWRHLWR